MSLVYVNKLVHAALEVFSRGKAWLEHVKSVRSLLENSDILQIQQDSDRE